MVAAAFIIYHCAFGELGMAYPLSQLESGGLKCGMGYRWLKAILHRTGYLSAKPHFLNTIARDLADKSRGGMKFILSVQTATLGIGDKEFLHCPSNPYVAKTTLFF